MGVQGLWQVLSPCARPVALESLAHKRLAVDASVWLYQFQLAIRDKTTGDALQGAHILGFFRRVLKLLYFGIKPVFVFDGTAPSLKRRTLATRKARRQGRQGDMAKTAERLLAAQMRKAALEHVGKRKEQVQQTAAAAAAAAAATAAARARAAAEEEDDTGDVIDANADYLDMVHPEDYAAAAVGRTDHEPRTRSPRKTSSAPPSTPPPPPPTTTVTTTNAETGPSTDTAAGTKKKKRYVPRDEYALPALDGTLRERAGLEDARLATDAELRHVIDELLAAQEGPDDGDDGRGSDDLLQALPIEMRYEILSDLRLRSRQVNHARVADMRRAPTALDFSRAQIANLRERNTLTQKLLAVNDTLGTANILVPVRVAGSRDREYVLAKQSDDKGGGWVLGVRDQPDAGTKDKPVVVDDHTTTDDDDGLHSETDTDEFEEVGIDDTTAISPLKVGSLGLGLGGASSHGAVAKQRAMARDALVKRYSPTKPAPQKDALLDQELLPLHGASGLFGGDDDDDDDDDDDAQVAQAVERSLSDTPAAAMDDDAELQAALAASLRETPPSTLAATSAPQPITVDDQEDTDDSLEYVAPRRNGQASPPPPPADSDDDEDEDMFEAVDTEMHARPAPQNRPAPSSLPPPPAPRPAPVQQQQQQQQKLLSAPQRQREPTAAPAATNGRAQNVASPMPKTAPPKTTATHQAAPSRRQSRPASSVEDGEPSPAPSELTTKPVVARDFGVQAPSQELAAPSPEVAATAFAQASDAALQSASFDEQNVEPLAETDTALSAAPLATVVKSEDEESSAPLRPTQPEPEEDEDAFEWEKSPTPPPRKSPTPTRQLDDDEAFSDWEKSPTPPPRSSQPALFRDSPEEEDEEQAQVEAFEREQAQFADMMSDLRASDMNSMRSEVEGEITRLRAQQNAEKRGGDAVTRQMAGEIKEMLELFGIPFVDAPSEAEAECANLLQRQLVDGIVTDDSDVFLFGGARIYRHMFNEAKYVECYLLDDIDRELGLDREKLVRLAFLLGSDYTEGLVGVGPVLGMEIMSEFPDSLRDFAAWWRRVQSGRDTTSDSATAFKRRFKKSKKSLYIDETWPSTEVVKAYMAPNVSTDDFPFSWSGVDLDGLRTYLRTYLSWAPSKTDEQILPLIKRMNAWKAGAVHYQSALSGFFDKSGGTSGSYRPPGHGVQSERMRNVINAWRKRRATEADAEAAEEVAKDETPEPSTSSGRGRVRGRGRGGARGGRKRSASTRGEGDEAPPPKKKRAPRSTRGRKKAPSPAPSLSSASEADSEAPPPPPPQERPRARRVTRADVAATTEPASD